MAMVLAAKGSSILALGELVEGSCGGRQATSLPESRRDIDILQLPWSKRLLRKTLTQITEGQNSNPQERVKRQCQPRGDHRR